MSKNQNNQKMVTSLNVLALAKKADKTAVIRAKYDRVEAQLRAIYSQNGAVKPENIGFKRWSSKDLKDYRQGDSVRYWLSVEVKSCIVPIELIKVLISKYDTGDLLRLSNEVSFNIKIGQTDQ